jgi:putative intracellular protease/amidase
VSDATVRFLAPEPGPVQDVPDSLPVHVPTRYFEVEWCDVLPIPGGGGTWTVAADPDFLGWVRHIHTGTHFTTSVRTGAL